MIRVVVDDLASVPADAVVRPATATLEPTSHALRRLEQIGGPAFWRQLEGNQALDVGAAVVTGAGELAAEYVIHAVIMSATEAVTPGGVRRALVSVLQRAEDWQLARVATPLLGTGPGNMTREDAAQIMADVLAVELRAVTYPEDVCIVVQSEEDRAIVEACLQHRIAR